MTRTTMINLRQVVEDGDIEGLRDTIHSTDGILATALHYAAANGAEAILDFLLSEGANVNATDRYGRTPLFMAVLNSNTENTQILLDHDADVNISCRCGTSSVSKAAENGNDQILSLLLRKHARIDTKNHDGETPEDLAQFNGHEKVLRKLRFYRKQQLRAFRDAAEDGLVDEMRVLISAGVDPHDRDRQGHSALDIAAQNGHLEVVSFLLKEVNASVVETDGRGVTPLHWAANMGHEKVVALLLDSGAPVRAWDREQMTPLHRAAQSGHHDAISQMIIRHNPGDDILNLRGLNGLTPLMLAASHGHNRTVQLLLDSGADRSLRDDHRETADDKQRRRETRGW